jgi:hypothetical protein
LLGYIRVAAEHVPKILQSSGSRGVFVDRLASDAAPPVPVAWAPHNPGEPWADYFARVCTDAATRAVPVAWRRGGGACLGLRGVAPAHTRAKWALHGVPKAWGPRTVDQWLCDSGWAPESIQAPRGRQRIWTFIAEALSKGSLDDKHDAWVYDLGEGGTINIRKWTRASPTDDAATAVMWALCPPALLRGKYEGSGKGFSIP